MTGGFRYNPQIKIMCFRSHIQISLGYTAKIKKYRQLVETALMQMKSALTAQLYIAQTATQLYSFTYFEITIGRFRFHSC